MNAGGHGSDMAATLGRVRVVDLRTGEDGGRGRARLSTSATAARRCGPTRSWCGPTSRWPPGDRGRGEAEIAEIVRWRREQPARRPERRVGVHQPRRRLGRPAHRRRRGQGPAARDAPRCRPSTPTSSRPTRAVGRRRPRADGRGPRPGPRGAPASTSCPRPAWSASRRRGGAMSTVAVDPRIRARRVAVRPGRRPAPPPPPARPRPSSSGSPSSAWRSPGRRPWTSSGSTSGARHRHLAPTAVTEAAGSCGRRLRWSGSTLVPPSRAFAALPWVDDVDSRADRGRARSGSRSPSGPRRRHRGSAARAAGCSSTARAGCWPPSRPSPTDLAVVDGVTACGRARRPTSDDDALGALAVAARHAGQRSGRTWPR